jgi:hypothetical protein
MYVRGYLQGSENGRVVTIDTAAYGVHFGLLWRRRRKKWNNNNNNNNNKK